VTTPRRICVFCGSSPGARPGYREAAVELGRTLAARGIGLVYGGARVGLMGALADAALGAGGDVIGVIPQMLLDKEVGHGGLTELRVVESMHQRKQAMADLSGGFIAMPGGMGTIEELAEILTWAQLGVHAKPVGVLNVAGYFEKLLGFLDHAVAERFLRPANRELLLVEDTPAALLDRMAAWAPLPVEKWLDRHKT
jgi:uncharacterized protein (TIGR00730 family)